MLHCPRTYLTSHRYKPLEHQLNFVGAVGLYGRWCWDEIILFYSSPKANHLAKSVRSLSFFIFPCPLINCSRRIKFKGRRNTRARPVPYTGSCSSILASRASSLVGYRIVASIFSG